MCLTQSLGVPPITVRLVSLTRGQDCSEVEGPEWPHPASGLSSARTFLLSHISGLGSGGGGILYISAQDT